MSPSPTLLYPKRSTTASTSSANASSTPTNDINAFSSKNGSLSIGAKAGIVLAALIVTALVLVGILFLMKRKKQTRKASMADAAHAGSGVGATSGASLARDQSHDSSLTGVELEKGSRVADAGVGEGGRGA